MRQHSCVAAGASSNRPPRMPTELVRLIGELPDGIAFANAVLDGRKLNKWFVGHFVDIPVLCSTPRTLRPGSASTQSGRRNRVAYRPEQ
jgi:hypothetical protein